jgi:cell division protein FtsB
MVRKTRIRAALIQLSLWTMIAAMIAYFGYHGVHGERGLRAHRNFNAEIAALNADLAAVQGERKSIEDRVARFAPNSVDRDLLDEEARESLGWLHPNDRVIPLLQ